MQLPEICATEILTNKWKKEDIKKLCTVSIKAFNVFKRIKLFTLKYVKAQPFITGGHLQLTNKNISNKYVLFHWPTVTPCIDNNVWAMKEFLNKAQINKQINNNTPYKNTV